MGKDSNGEVKTTTVKKDTVLNQKEAHPKCHQEWEREEQDNMGNQRYSEEPVISAG